MTIKSQRLKILIDILTKSGTIKTRSEAKRLIRQGAIEIDGRVFKE